MLEFRIPEIGENIKSGTVVGIMVSVGDKVSKDQDLIELETEKASLPIPSPCDGVIKKIHIKVNQEVKIGEVVLSIEEARQQTQAGGEVSPILTPEIGGQPKIQAPAKSVPESSQAADQPQASAARPSPLAQNVVVLGGGPGGYAAAFLAADLGLTVTLVDKDTSLGGVCLLRGCIPSKALLHAAKVISESRAAEDFGVEFDKPKIHLNKLRDWKNDVVKKLSGGVSQLTKQRKIKYIQGTGELLNAQHLLVKKSDGSQETIPFDKIILATGSRPITLPLFPKSKRVMDSTAALEVESIPKSMLLVGGGYIGLELGTVYAELGTDVSVVEMMPQILTNADRDVIAILQKRLDKIMKKIMLQTKVTKAEETAKGINCTFEDKGGKVFTEEYEKVLVAIGRCPNTEGLGLETTNVKIDARGFVEVNTQLQTAEPSIYAIGDMVGNPMLAHKASHEGRVAAEHIAGHKVTFEPRAIPAVVFTDPEVAWAGLTENEAKEQDRSVEVVKFPWGASGRAITLNRTDGLTKLLIDPITERILGVTIIGHGAGELIAEGVLAIEMGAVATDLRLSIHPHPTLTETLMETAEIFFGQSTHIYRPKKK